MTPQSQSSPGTTLRRRSTAALRVRPEVTTVLPRTVPAEAVRADRRPLERWENEGGALEPAGAGSRAVPEGATA